MNDNKKISYKNTLIYTIVTAVISAALLIGLAFRSIFDYVYFIAVVEVGIFIIIGVCIYKIVTFDKRLEKLKEDRRFYIPFSECPDYFVKKYDRAKGEPYCSNEHRVSDSTGKEYLMKIYPSSGLVSSLPSVHEDGESIDFSSKNEKFWLNHIASSKELKTTREKCGVIMAKPNNPALSAYNEYSDLPWTSVRGKCDGYF